MVPHLVLRSSLLMIFGELFSFLLVKSSRQNGIQISTTIPVMVYSDHELMGVRRLERLLSKWIQLPSCVAHKGITVRHTPASLFFIHRKHLDCQQ